MLLFSLRSLSLVSLLRKTKKASKVVQKKRYEHVSLFGFTKKGYQTQENSYYLFFCMRKECPMRSKGYKLSIQKPNLIPSKPSFSLKSSINGYKKHRIRARIFCFCTIFEAFSSSSILISFYLFLRIERNTTSLILVLFDISST